MTVDEKVRYLTHASHIGLGLSEWLRHCAEEQIKRDRSNGDAQG